MLGINRKHHSASTIKKQWQIEEEEYEKEQQSQRKESQKDDQKFSDNLENLQIPQLDEEEEKKLKDDQIAEAQLQKFDWMSDSDVEHLKNCSGSDEEKEEKEEIDEEVEKILKEQADKERKIRERKLNIQQIDDTQNIIVQQISSDDRDQRTIFIYNLPFDMTNKEIENYFQKFGTIIVCEVPKNEGSLVNKGRAFIEYSTVSEAQHAQNAQNQQIRGRYIKINQGLTNVVSSLASSTNKLQTFKEKKHKSHHHRSSSSSSSSQDRKKRKKEKQKKKRRHSRSRSKSINSNSSSSKSKNNNNKSKHKSKKHKNKY